MKYTFIDLLNVDADKIRNILENLDDNGILREMLPELIALKGVDKTKESFHKDNFYHTLQVVENTYYVTKNPWLRLVAILHDIGKAKTKEWIDGTGWSFHNHEYEGSKMLLTIFKRLDIPMEHYDYVHKLVMFHGIPKMLSKDVTDSALRRFGTELGEDLEDMFLFCKCDITSKIKEKKEYQIKSYSKVYDAIIAVKKKDEKAKWRCPIDGNLIMNYFGVKGAMVGKIKLQIEDAIKTGVILDSYDAAFEYMKQIKI